MATVMLDVSPGGRHYPDRGNVLAGHKRSTALSPGERYAHGFRFNSGHYHDGIVLVGNPFQVVRPRIRSGLRCYGHIQRSRISLPRHRGRGGLDTRSTPALLPLSGIREAGRMRQLSEILVMQPGHLTNMMPVVGQPRHQKPPCLHWLASRSPGFSVPIRI